MFGSRGATYMGVERVHNERFESRQFSAQNTVKFSAVFRLKLDISDLTHKLNM